MDTCAFDSPEVSDVSEGTSFEPTADLTVRDTAPVGTPYAWRVRACDRTERCSGWSTPAYVNVGRTEHDLDGDGYADVLATSTQGTEVYLGGPNFNGQADARLPSQYGHFVGDLNGDGFADVAGNLGAGSCGGSIEEAVRILYGAADLSDGPSLQTETLCRTGGTISVARMIVDAGDLDGDGFDDLAVAWGSVQTSLLVFLGGDAFRQHDLLQRSAHPDDSARGRGRPALGLFLADLESPRAERTASEPVLGDHWSGAEEPSLARGGPRRMPARQKGRAVINTTIAKNTPSTAG